MSDWVVLGRVSGLYGIQGWVKVFSHTEPRQQIIAYDPVFLNFDGSWQPFAIVNSRAQGKGMIVQLDCIQDREAAAALVGCDIAIPRTQLPELESDEYYWFDLEGMCVVTLAGVELGTVSHLFTTGANDVLVVMGDRERLIPFIREQVIYDINRTARIIRVDWDTEF